MTHVAFNPDSIDWTPFLAAQQEGRGELQYFVGTKYQRGGGLLQNVAKFLMPVASNLLSSASKEGVAAGSRVLEDLAQGKQLKESIQTHAKQGFQNLADKLQQCGKGRKKKRMTSSKTNIHDARRINGKRRRRQVIDQLSFVP
jgi:hypothetical protein